MENKITYPKTRIYENEKGKLVIELLLTENEKEKLLVEYGKQTGKMRKVFTVDIKEYK